MFKSNRDKYLVVGIVVFSFLCAVLQVFYFNKEEVAEDGGRLYTHIIDTLNADRKLVEERYLNDENEVKVENITFKTKGESSYPSVALASVMARYAFLLEKQRLEEHYKMTFPFGAGTKADEFSKEFVKKYGLKEFEKICKKNFSNYQEITKIDLL